MPKGIGYESDMEQKEDRRSITDKLKKFFGVKDSTKEMEEKKQKKKEKSFLKSLLEKYQGKDIKIKINEKGLLSDVEKRNKKLQEAFDATNIKKDK